MKNKNVKKDKIVKSGYYKNFFQIKRYIIFLKAIIVLINLFEVNTFWNITLKIKGKGFQNVFSNYTSYFPDEVYINGIIQNQVNYSYYFNQTESEVELIWNNSLNNCHYMFYECSNIKEITFCNFDTLKILYMDGMFYGCSSLKSLNLSNFDTSNVINMNNMFYNCSSLQSLDLSNFDTSQTIDMDNMFYRCSSLQSLDLSNFDTSNVINMNNMFYNCSSLKTLDLSNFDTSQTIDMDNMFYGCSSLKSLDLTNFDTSNVINMTSLFYNCFSLKSLSLLKFDTTQVKEMNNMFYNCSSLNLLDLSNFNTSNVINMSNMFYNCSSLTSLNLSKFDTSQVERMDNMFSGCLKLEYINLENFEEIINGTYNNMFENITYNVIICINESITQNEIFPQIQNITNYTIDCSNDCQLEKCQTCSPLSTRKNLCIECNSGGGYFPKEKDLTNIGDYINCYKEIEGYYLDNITLLFKKCYDSCKTCEIGGDKISHNCLECEENFIYELHYKNYKNCYDIINVDYFEYPFNIFKTKKFITTSFNTVVVYECLLDDPLNNDCYFINITNNTEILNLIRDNILSIYDPYNKKSQIIKGEENIIFQITDRKNELELLNGSFLNNQDISIIDLGTCETTLKGIYDLNENDSLIYLKQENITTNVSEKNIQYEVYNPSYNFSKLNLSFCEGDIINIYVKIELINETKIIYEEMKSLGFDMLNIKDNFYQDICSTYKTSNNTDILLSDRINYIYNNKDSQCQSNCYFSSYLSNSLYLNCTCEMIEEKNFSESKFNTKITSERLSDVSKNFNFKIFNCYKLIFNNNFFTKNLGNITIMIFFIIYLFCLIIYLIKGIEPLKNKIKNKNSKKEENDLKNNDVFIFFKEEDKISQKQSNNKIISSPPNKRKIPKNIFVDKKNKMELQIQPRKKNFDEYWKNKNILKNKLMSSSWGMMNISKRKDISKVIEYLKDENKNKKENDKKYCDVFELNNLEYEEAVLLDNRNCIQIYCNILRREHLIISILSMCHDYNLLIIKCARFIFLIATNMAMNVFLLSDYSIHKIYLNYGKYNINQLIAQIISSTVISILLDIFLCFLSLTDKYIFRINNLNQSSDKFLVFKILRCVKLKIFYFFTLTFIAFGFYWYSVAAFCAIYQNTQVILLKNSLFSFLLSLLYPFVLYLFPALLRVLSLKCRIKGLYNLSGIIPFF